MVESSLEERGDMSPGCSRSTTFHRDWLLLAALTLLAFGLRIWGGWANLPDVPNPDEYLMIWPSLRIGYGNLAATRGYPPLVNFVLFFEYAAYFLLGYALRWFSSPMDFAFQMIANPTPLYLIARTTMALIGAATVPLLYQVGKTLYDRRVGLIAALFLTFDFVHAMVSKVAKVDAPMVFLLCLSFLFSARVLKDGKTRDYLLAGLFAGLAAAAKYNALLVALPLALAHLLRNWREGGSWLKVLNSKPLWLGGLCVILGFWLGYPHLVLDPGMFWLGLTGNSLDFFWSWLGFEGLPPGWIYYPWIVLRAAYGLPLQFLIWAGFLAALYRHKERDILCLAMPLLTYLMMSRFTVNQPRYFLPATPFLLLLAAKLLTDMTGKLYPEPAEGLPARKFRYLSAALAILLVILPAYQIVFQDYVYTLPDPRVTSRQWIESHIPSGSRVVLDMEGPRLMESSESWRANHPNPPPSRFLDVEQKVRAMAPVSYWILRIVHFVNREPYRQGWEASVQSLDLYRENDYRYIVTSSSIYEDYTRWPGVAERYPKTMTFYRSLEERATLLAEFRPPLEDNGRDFGTTDLSQIPTIRVYQLP
jgi:hypothetical protein